MSDRLQEVEEAKRNSAYILKGFGLTWRAVRYQPLPTVLLVFGLAAAPGALMGMLSGVFFGAAVPSSAPMADRMGNWLGAGVVRPFAATAVVATEYTYRTQLASYKPDAKVREAQPDRKTIEVLNRFATQNKVVFTNFKTK